MVCLLVLAGMAQVDVTGLASAETAMSMRSPSLGQNTPSLNTALEPMVGLRLRRGADTLSLAYNPTLSWRGMLSQGQATLVHEGSLLLEVRGTRARYRLAQNATYGLVDTSLTQPLAGAPEGTVEVINLGLQPFGRSRTTAGVQVVLDETTGLDVSGGYQLSGGLADARLPFQRGPFADVRLAHRLSEVNALGAGLSGSYSDFSTRQSTGVLTLSASWSHRFARATQGDLGGGLAGAYEKAAPAPTGWQRPPYYQLLPVASASLSHATTLAEQPLETRYTLRAAPYVDRLTAAVNQRADGSVRLSWRTADHFRFTAGGGAAWVLPYVVGTANQVNDRAFYADGSATYSTRPEWQLGASTQLYWVQQPRLGLSYFQWEVGATLTLRDQTLL